MRLKHRVVTALAALPVLLGGLATASTAAQAAPAAHPQLTTVSKTVNFNGCQYYYNYAYLNGVEVGYALWSRDPCGSDPGDALKAGDEYADGYGIHAYLSTGRMASTAGHSSPYESPWVTGNLPEDTAYGMNACLEKGGVDYACTAGITVYS